MGRHSLAAAISGLLLALALALPVQASGTAISMLTCNGNGQQWDVNPLSNVTFKFTWATVTKAQAVNLKNHSNVRFTVRGTAIASPNSYWGAPVDQGSYWGVSWRYPFGPLGVGNSARTTMQVTLTAPVFDGVGTVPAGPYFDPILKCKIY